MHRNLGAVIDSIFGPDYRLPGYLRSRWLFLRALGPIFFSAFYSLAYQIRGLTGPHGILPAHDYLLEVSRVFGSWRFWAAPSIFWWSASDRAMLAVCVVGMLASLALAVNICPRGMLAICMVGFLTFIATAQDFASYQSDGMLLEAGFIGLFFAPSGWRPGLASGDPPSRASRYLLVWEFFRIYFESGIAKILGHDPQWRNFTAMDQYYQNGPLPTWIGWYAQQLPHGFHRGTAILTLTLELVLIFGMFLPRRARIILFFIVTPWQLGIIMTSNYAFLNYLVLVLGVLLLDDRFWGRLTVPSPVAKEVVLSSYAANRTGRQWRTRVWLSAFFLTWIFYATSARLLRMVVPEAPLPDLPVRALQPFRIANDFGLFAVMTRGRYEIEFQGSNNGQDWIAYPFRYKPQDINAAPRIYAPYQPRFEWNLWFASLGDWREYPFVLRTEQRLLAGEPTVLALFANDPFPGKPPLRIRVVLWQYWFSTPEQKRQRGVWWTRQFIGLYAPALERAPDGKVVIVEWPDDSRLSTVP